MEKGKVKDIRLINIGDRVAEGGTVIGYVLHKLEFPYFKVSEGLFVAPGSMLLSEDKVDIVAGDEYMPVPNTVFAMNLLTENAVLVVEDAYKNRYTFLDDQEVPDQDIHDRRDKKVIESLKQ